MGRRGALYCERGVAAETPAATADAEQHARQDIAGLSTRLGTRLPRGTWPLAAGAGILVSGWLILRRRRRR
jgi:LPXTG-motif cell wall-anchored protein